MNRVKRIRLGSVARWLWLGAVVLVVVLPVYVTVVTALLPRSDVAAGRLLPVPGRLTLDNVRFALDAAPLARQYLVSVAVTVGQAGPNWSRPRSPRTRWSSRAGGAGASSSGWSWPPWRSRGRAWSSPTSNSSPGSGCATHCSAS
ncbi:hypothetical protein ACIQOU_34955 [Streptomyces sp. NPDC091279]|uniref:hypothetical protein n=1 Tax=Streptomyces sp. NPDC091279 TaxID=3365983 RepID=UPI0038061B27